MSVAGLDELVADLAAFADDVKAPGRLLDVLAPIVEADAATKIHNRSRRLVNTLAASSDADTLTITAGGPRAPYGIFHAYGARSFPGTQFLTPDPALIRRAATEAEQTIENLLDRHHLT